MAGGSDGSLRRCTAKSEAAAVTEPQASLTSCSNKRKAKKEAGSSGQEADKTVPAPAPAKAEKAGVNKYRLSAKEIKWILAQKPEPPPARYQALKRSNPELTPRPGEEDDKDKVLLYCVARAFYEREERLPKMQEGVRSELASKGYVEVDGDYLKRKAEVQAVIDRESLFFKSTSLCSHQSVPRRTWRAATNSAILRKSPPFSTQSRNNRGSP
jgi:hypothetical protein